jgi:hypothetical protein
MAKAPSGLAHLGLDCWATSPAVTCHSQELLGTLVTPHIWPEEPSGSIESVGGCSGLQKSKGLAVLAVSTSTPGWGTEDLLLKPKVRVLL